MVESHPIIEKVLKENKKFLLDDFDKYRNHVYRVFNLCLMQDDNPDNNDKYAIAAVFHDLGIWTNNTFDYLQPSIEKAIEFLGDKRDLQEEISLMIDFHHKIKVYDGRYSTTVEIFRRADWIVVSKGQMKFGLKKNEITRILKAFPSLGFHRFLFKQTVKQFLKHPSNPLPMFK